MKSLIPLGLLIVLLNFNRLQAQNTAYVTADNGLTVREQPYYKARKVGVLYYGEGLSVTERTNNKLVIKDAGATVEGQWVKIQTPSLVGYVFDGYLSPHKIAERLEFYHKGLSLKLKDLSTTDEFRIHTLHDTDTVTVTVALGASPEGKRIVVDNKAYKRVSIFQRYDTGIRILNEGPQCDLSQWLPYESKWVPVKRLGQTQFQILTYSPKEYQNATTVTVEAIKQEVRERCGENWGRYVKAVKDITDYPISIGIQRIFLKLILTDHDDHITEKVIEFKLPTGC